jgi:hypothetical protein
VRQSYDEAAGWYRQAADQGLPRAQYELGNMYERGEGVLQDYVRAHMWFNLASRGVDDRQNAINNRDKLAQRMTPAQIAEAQKLAREWKPKTQPSN